VSRLDDIDDRVADAAVAFRPDRVCVVLTADCLPVLLCDRAGTRVGIAHAGWRGLAAGVVEAAVAALECAPAELMAWLGPAIGPEAFEVGVEVRAQFIAKDVGAEAAFEKNARGRWQADLYALARRRLARAGVDAVYGAVMSTHADPRRFYSHRRDGPCGRMANLIWLSAA
jgi:YfiH family protein